MSKRTNRERLRAILEMPYVKLPIIATIFLLIGLAIEYLFLTIASVYILATSIGAQNLQIVVGTISATGTVTSAAVAYLLYRNSTRGSEITVAVDDLLEPETEYRIKRTLATEVPMGATQELFEKLHFEFPIVWLNTGPKGGAITNVELKLVKPVNHFPTVLANREASEDNISVSWTMKISKPEERIDFNSVRLPTFSFGSQNSMSIGNNESIAVTTRVDLFLMDKEKGAKDHLRTVGSKFNKRPPTLSSRFNGRRLPRVD